MIGIQQDAGPRVGQLSDGAAYGECRQVGAHGMRGLCKTEDAMDVRRPPNTPERGYARFE